MPSSSRPETSPPAPVSRMQGLWDQYRAVLAAPITPAPLAYFRIVFGAIMLWEVTRYLEHDWVETYYIDPEFFFTYPGFGWVQPWPDGYMAVHFLLLGILAVFIAAGLFYRVSAALFFLGFTYVFLLDQSNYLNHFYLISLISFLMIFVPAHRAVSLDVVRKPGLAAETVPAWSLWLLRFQIAVPYFFGGIAKLNGDWLRGEPMRSWLADETAFPVIGPYFVEPWAPYLFSYGGLLLDLLVVPLLLWKRTRLAGYLMALTFHLMNAHLFQIGIFPWFMIGATLLFFEPERFRPILRWQQRLGAPAPPGPPRRVPERIRRLVPGLLAAWMAVQILVPLRHWLYPGNVSWTEEGHNFSWHMKLRDKEGDVEVIATDPTTGRMLLIDPRDFLTARQ
ncbi:MAG: HTTM domain-containing protein, partial [Rhodothermales bacterium]|nr:HTTM domain-containing protein [Rhodothermales bacterium]